MGFWRARPDPCRPRLWVLVAVYVGQLLIITFASWAAATGFGGEPWSLIILLPLAVLIVRAIIRELRRPG